ncbi:MAG: DUF1824 family protein [Cyanobacteria bacterium P01_D01_bin.73]
MSQSSAPRQTTLTFEEAQQVLAAFNGLDTVPALSAEQCVLIQRSLQVLAQITDTCIFGICADNLDEALQALNQYAAGLNYELPGNGPDLRGNLNDSTGVYMKCNLQSGLFYVSTYENNHRGVLLSYRSVEYPDIAPLYGHLPLTLFSATETAG